ncbi:MAG: PorT family protein [Bacteroidetes bacterium]|nr:MAG: PorT family protein [Bacteroidota bacterium]
MKAKIISLLAALIFSVTVFAQSFSVGFRTGANLSNYQSDYDYDLYSNVLTKTNTGFTAGVFANIPMFENFSLQPEINYIEKGAKVYPRQDVYMSRNETTWRYLEIPVLAKYRITSDKGNFYLSGGPFAGYAMSAVQDLQNWPSDGGEGGINRISDDNLKYNFRSDYDTNGQKDNRFDFGLAVGAGVEFNVGPGQFLLDARYGWDLTDNVQFQNGTPDNYPGTFHRDFSITAGYAFPIGGNK